MRLLNSWRSLLLAQKRTCSRERWSAVAHQPPRRGDVILSHHHSRSRFRYAARRRGLPRRGGIGDGLYVGRLRLLQRADPLFTDLQAIWWHPEKELYSKLGGRDSEAINIDYTTRAITRRICRILIRRRRR